MRHIDTKKIKTRKEHRCVGCSRKFPKGTKMEINKYVMDGKIRNDYWCETCCKYAARYLKGKYEFLPGEFKGVEDWEKVKEELER